MTENTRWISPTRERRLLLSAIVASGLLIRILIILGAFPHLLLSDEINVVEPALTLIRDNTYISDTYFHPDHIQIKVCAFLFNVYSLLRYGVSASELGGIPAFYVIARLFSASCGVALIAVSYAISERIFKGSGIFSAALVAFFPPFISHSAIASPDMPLSLIIGALIFLGIAYLDHPQTRIAVLMGILVGAGITTKYPAALMSLFGLVIVLYRARLDGTYIPGFKHISIAALAVVVTVFLVSPNLITDLPTVLQWLQSEARPNHLGADGLGFFGNMHFYFTTFFSVPHSTSNDIAYMCWELILPLTIGILTISSRNHHHLIALTPGVFLFFVLSMFALHWVRWGLPMYVAPLIVCGVGIHAGFKKAASFINNWKRASKNSDHAITWCNASWIAFSTFSVLILGNFIISSAVLGKAGIATPTRIAAQNYCIHNDITAENCAFDGYTPFSMRDPAFSQNSFPDGSDDLTPNDEKIEYVMIGSYMYERYSRSNPNHTSAINYYEKIDKGCQKLRTWKSTRINQPGPSILNIIEKIKYLARPLGSCLSGPTIILYKLPNG